MGFFERLEQGIRSASESALIKSVVADPDETIGGIISALENQKDGKLLIPAFKDLTIGQIVHAAMENIQATMDAEEAQGGAGAFEPEEPELEPEPEVKAKAPARPKAPKKTRAAKKTNGTSDEKIDLSTPEKLKAYENSILKALKRGSHVDSKTGISNQELRQIVGGTAKQARKILDELIANGRCKYYGKARGTRYYLYA